MSNIPKLRFPEFTDAWEKCKLGEVAKRVKGNDGDMSLPTLTISAGSGWLDQKDRFSGNIAGSEQKNYTLLKRGQLSYNHGNSKLAKYGAVFVLRTYEKALVPRVYHSFTMLNNADADFIEFLFATKIPDKELVKKITSGARTDGLLNISFEGFMDIAITLPTLPEQQKIGALFRRLDRLITLHKRKWDDVILLKKALLQKMFPKNGSDFPEIRFPEFTDAWEKCKLGKIAIKVTEKNKDGIFQETLTNSAEFGVISQRDFFDKDISNPENLNGYYIVKPNDFVYNPRISNLAPVGPIKRNQLNRIGIMSPLYFIFRVSSNIDLDFLDSFFSTNLWHLFMKLNGDSGARADRIAIKDKIFMEMPISFPTLSEQQKIGNLFKQLDRLITLHKRQHEHYQLLKKALLQQMFV
ncbi:restriction endonuclease subunit S [Gallibacterium anatis]|uniref:restriction endonuclease subunit S n=1 Tax=Gallibacterium anatis TaxID=750 RepID=UPI0030047C44